MITAHVVLWVFFLVMGLSLWLVAENGGYGSKLHGIVYVLFYISLWGIGFSILGLLVKLVAMLAGF